MEIELGIQTRKCITCFLRLIIGGVFILSGFAKAIDPWGTLYKVNDYLAALSISVWPNLTLVGVFFLCGLEFSVGIFLLLGCFRKSISIVALLIMAFMLPLSLWIAVSNPVADCGCFGDAFILSNWATFWKNIVLTSGLIWLLKFNRECFWIITPALQWLVLIATGIFIMTIELYGYVAQPLIDFREYKIGECLIEEEQGEAQSPKFSFIYEKNGMEKEFLESDSLPSEEDGWVFVDRKELPAVSNSGGEEVKKSLRIWTEDGSEDVTEDVILKEGKELIVMISDIEGVSPSTSWQLNSLYEWSLKNNVEMIGVVAGNREMIEGWEDFSMASYPIYTAEDTQIKEVVRGNPAIVYLEEGKIIWKTSLKAINVDDFLSPETSEDAKSFAMDNGEILKNCCWMYFVVLGMLVVFSFTPQFKNWFIPRQKEKEKNKAND